MSTLTEKLLVLVGTGSGFCNLDSHEAAPSGKDSRSGRQAAACKRVEQERVSTGNETILQLCLGGRPIQVEVVHKLGAGAAITSTVSSSPNARHHNRRNKSRYVQPTSNKWWRRPPQRPSSGTRRALTW